MKKIVVVIPVVCLLAATWYILTPQSIFASRGLENVIREQIGKPVGVITPDDCRGITELDLSLSDWNTSLKGLQYFVDLEILNSSAGRLSDISALSELTQLRELTLRQNNISDLTTLSGLTNLERLDITGNRVRDLSPLASLTNLKSLVIGQNPVERLPDGFAPLAHLHGLSIGALADYSIVVGKDELISPHAR